LKVTLAPGAARMAASGEERVQDLVAEGGHHALPAQRHGYLGAARRDDLGRTAARQHAGVGMAADHGDGLGALGQRKQPLAVLQQNDAFLRDRCGRSRRWPS
jgi:hypothetical protein